MWDTVGATIWARQTLTSDIFYNKPDKWFKIWFFMVQRVNHKDNKKFKRGTCFTQYSQIMEYTGATKGQVDHCIRWLKSATMIATRKTTRGMMIKVLKYDHFQQLDTYKNDTKSDSTSDLKAKQKRHYKQEREEREEEIQEDKSSEEPIIEEFSSKEYINKMITNKQKHIILIGKYFKTRKINFPSKKAAQDEIKRWTKDARTLSEYPEDQINRTFSYVCDKFPEEWNLSTIRKYITNN